ncbi:hypothetical protein TNCV_3276341 [Trichonephila clavipes]|nr:hypothetical protein TNCV_3276341 [Trichonephila clavipes]
MSDAEIIAAVTVTETNAVGRRKNSQKFNEALKAVEAILQYFKQQASLSRGNRKKSGGLRSGENGGCSICTTPFFATSYLTILTMAV